MRLPSASRVAVIGAGPGGLVAAKNLLESGFEVVVFEAGDAIGGQWRSRSDTSGIWPGMRTNTSRAMTAFSDLPYAPELDLHPAAEQIHDYLLRYAATFDLHRHLRLATPVRNLEAGWTVDGEPFDAVVLASGRFRKPIRPPELDRFAGTLLHAFDYPGADALCNGRTLVYGNGVSGHEIAADIGLGTPVVSAYRKPRYVLQKTVHGVSSDWQWYTQLGALQRRTMATADYGRMLRERVVRVAGNPADFGAPRPDDDILVAGHSLSQDYLRLVRDQMISCRPAIAAIHGRTVTFADGTSESVDAIISATGYELDLPYLSEDLRRVFGPRFALHEHTLHPSLPALGVIGQFALQGPYFPLLELQARWLAGLWSGTITAPAEPAMQESVRRAPPAVVPHHLVALALAEAAGVAPDLARRPELVEPLLLGPMLPPRYRLDGPGADPLAAALFATQLAASPCAPVEAEDLAFWRSAGLP